jgi:DNA-binding transcriptional MerR regulator
MKKSLRDNITAQCLEEIAFNRKAKQGVLAEWKKNELVLQKMLSDGERNNVDLGEGVSFVNTFLSKINSPYNFKYEKGDEADLKPAKIANAIKEKDAKLGRWNYKVMLARTELIQYGRYIFEYHADSIGGYNSHLTNVSAYQFLIDPSVGGTDIEKAFNMGRGGIIKTKKQIQEGVRTGLYLRTESDQLISSTATGEKTNEEKEAESRWVKLIANDTVISAKDRWKFWEWYTTYEGTRYYCLVTEQGGGVAVRIQELESIFATNLYPFFSVAAYPEISQFWTPAPLATVREVIMAKSTSINQMLDNGEAINRPMKAFDVSAIKNPALLKFRKDGLMPVKEGIDINKAVKFFPVIPLSTSIEVYDKLGAIVDTNSGVNAGTRGLSTEDKVGIYEGNQQNASDRFSLIGDSEADGQQRFAQLYMNGLDEHMTGKVAVEMIGINGIEFKKVSKKDIKRNADFNVVVTTVGTEETMETTQKKNKLTFLSTKVGDVNYNQKVIGEMEATIAGFNIDEVKRMLDTKNDTNAEIMSECARDIEALLANEDIEPNEVANNAYKQKMVDYLRDQQENITLDQANRIFAYIDSLDEIIARNMNIQMNEQLASEGLPTTQGLASGMMGQAQLPGQELPLPTNQI